MPHNRTFSGIKRLPFITQLQWILIDRFRLAPARLHRLCLTRPAVREVFAKFLPKMNHLLLHQLNYFSTKNFQVVSNMILCDSIWSYHKWELLIIMLIIISTNNCKMTNVEMCLDLSSISHLSSSEKSWYEILRVAEIYCKTLNRILMTVSCYETHMHIGYNKWR